MATEKEDTDPSSPGALRSSSPRSGRTAAAAHAPPDRSDLASGRHPTTDPGLGPAALATSSSARKPATGLRVPPPSARPSPPSNAITPPELTPIAAPPSRAKDSVELLLEGMAGPRPDRRKTTPQSDGEASAMYHAEHGVRPARTSSDPAPKVLVERSSPGSAVNPRERQGFVTRPPQDRDKEGNAPRLASRESLSTFVPARVLRRRMAVALVAGLLIVMLFFVGFRLTVRDPQAPVPGAAVRVTPVVSPVSPAGPATATGIVQVAATSAGVTAPMSATGASGSRGATASPADAPVGSSGARPEAVSGGPGDSDGTTKTRGRAHHPEPAGSSRSDLGEFKTTF